MSEHGFQPTPLQRIGRARLYADAIQAYQPEFLPPELLRMAAREGLIIQGRRASSWNTLGLRNAHEGLLERIYCTLALTLPEGTLAEEHRDQWLDRVHPMW